MFYPNAPFKLSDSRQHGSGTELLIVEGDSAANAVAALRDFDSQATLPMQGKPLNALKASAQKAAQYPLFQALADSLGTGMGADFRLEDLRFDRVVLLFDPDADGIHSSALMLMFFYKHMRPLLEMGKVEMVQPPWMCIYRQGQTPYFTYSHAHSQDYCQQLRSLGVEFASQRYRGLAGIESDVLLKTCIQPTTRHARRLGIADAEAAIAAFGTQH